jgi:hypothetical protein
MRLIQCPDVFTSQIGGRELPLFLAGGITGTKVWQDDLINLIGDQPERLVIINPRRKNYDTLQPGIEEEQIKWEWEHIRKSSLMSFWFPPETLCPIALFELGKALNTSKPIFIGCDPNYQRKNDVIIQTRLERPWVKVVFSVEELASQIRERLESL